MKIGILCEGEMTDEPVLKLLLGSLFPELDFEVKGVSKKIIFQAADAELKRMFDRNVERFLVIWDLLPVGRGMGVECQWSEKPNRREQRKKLLELLCGSSNLPTPLSRQARHLAYRYQFDNTLAPHPNGNDDILKLVCVCYAMDGWLLSDKGLLCRLLSTPAHTHKLDSDPGLPDTCKNPAQALKKCCSSAPNKRMRYYNKAEHNRVIANAYVENGSIDKMRVSGSFCRVADSIKEWIRNEI